MNEETVASVKGPALLALVSGASCAVIVFAWLQFPFFVPLAVLIILGTLTAVTAIVAEVIVVLRFARRSRLGSQPHNGIRNLSKRPVIVFFLLLVLGNSVLVVFLQLGAWAVWAANLAFVISWFSAWSLAAGKIHNGRIHKG